MIFDKKNSKEKKKIADKSDNTLNRRDFLVASSGLMLSAAMPLGCGGNDKTEATASSVDPAAKGTPWAGTVKASNLLETVHTADISHHGEFIDFGTAARFKYTLGGWMAGWDKDTSLNGVKFTWATKSPSRIYFSIPKPEPLVFEFRVKRGGSDYFSVYLNDNPLQKISFKSNDWEIHKVSATAEQSKAGENYFKLIYQTASEKVDGSPASFCVDYMRIIPSNVQSPTNFDPPYLARLQQRYKAGNQELDALILTTPITLSYYTDIPASSSLCFRAAQVNTSTQEKKTPVKLTVRVTAADGAPPIDIFSGSYNDKNWVAEKISLAKFAGKLARIDILAEGKATARLALGEPAIRVAPPKLNKAAGKTKNVIVLLVDTLRADKLAPYGNKRVKATAFEKFTKESTLFKNCQSTSNWTKPSCASVLTGLYPDSHKARGHSSRLGKSVKMASELFRGAGFSTAAFIANGYLASEFGFNRGWNKYVNYIRESKNTDAKNVYKDALAFIGEQKDKPFFTYIQTIDPHVPYDPPKEDLKIYDAGNYEGPIRPRSTGNLLEEFKRKKVDLNARDRRHLEALYDGEITYHDRHFGRFLDGLNKQGVLNDTTIIVCADHGEEFFEHESVGHGHTLHQELLHVPLVVRSPGLVPAGKKIGNSVGLADVLPTALGSVGQKVPRGMEGTDLIHVASGALEHPQNASFSSFWSEADDRNLQWSIRKGDWKLRMKGPVNTYVHNLKDDPHEKVDVDERYPIALRALRILLGQFIAAPDKSDWLSNKIAADIVTKPKGKEDKNENLPEDLKDQLRQLGYMQ